MASFYPPCPVDVNHGPLDLLETNWTRPDPAGNVLTSQAGVDRLSKGRDRLRMSETLIMRLVCSECRAEVQIQWPTLIEALSLTAAATEPTLEPIPVPAP